MSHKFYYRINAFKDDFLYKEYRDCYGVYFKDINTVRTYHTYNNRVGILNKPLQLNPAVNKVFKKLDKAGIKYDWHMKDNFYYIYSKGGRKYANR
jgi:hypothetical protein